MIRSIPVHDGLESLADALLHDCFNARMKYEIMDPGISRQFFLGQYEAYYTCLQLLELQMNTQKYTEMFKTSVAEIIRMKHKKC